MPLPRKLLLFCFLPYYTDMILLVFVGFLSSLFLLKVMCLLLTLYPTSSFTCTPPLLGSNETNVFQSSTQTSWFSSLPWYQSHFKLHVSAKLNPKHVPPHFFLLSIKNKCIPALWSWIHPDSTSSLTMHSYVQLANHIASSLDQIRPELLFL